MYGKVSIFERAGQLAATGQFPRVSDVKLALKREGYDRVDQHLDGKGIYDELRARIRAALPRLA